MIGVVFVAAVLVGTGYAAYLDLRTTEVPDGVSLAVAGIGVLFHAFQAVQAGSASPLLLSLGTGAGFFLVGWGMYLAGLWGGADAFVLGALGFALPALPAGVTPVFSAPWPFALSLLMTVFLAGAVYSLVYVAAVAVRHDGFAAAFADRLRDRRRDYLRLSGLYLAVTAVLGGAAVVTVGTPPLYVAERIALFYVLFAAALLTVQFLRTVEASVMERAVPVDELQPGDVLADEYELEAEGRPDDDPVEHATSRIAATLDAVLPFTVPRLSGQVGPRVVGVTAAEIDELAEVADTVTVKQGVPFILAFPLAVLILATLGDPFYAIALLLA